MTDLSDIVTSAFWRVNPPDADPAETREWLEAFDALVQSEGRERATFLLRKLLDHARARRVPLPPVLNTPYKNTVALAEQPQFPGNLEIESAHLRDRALERARDGGARQPRDRRARRPHRELCVGGGSLRSRLQPFLPRGRGGDLVYFQPHSAPGVYARAFLEGRLSEEQPRQLPAGDAAARGCRPYCHPWLMPEFWQFPTGSMGLGPLNAIYQARFMRYLEHRGILRDGAAARSGRSSATARWTSPSRSPGLSLAAREGSTT